MDYAQIKESHTKFVLIESEHLSYPQKVNKEPLDHMHQLKHKLGHHHEQCSTPDSNPDYKSWML